MAILAECPQCKRIKQELALVNPRDRHGRPKRNSLFPARGFTREKVRGLEECRQVMKRPKSQKIGAKGWKLGWKSIFMKKIKDPENPLNP